MSFSDLGRTAMAAISPTVAATCTQLPPSGVRKSRNSRRSSDPLPPRRSSMDGNDATPMTTATRTTTTTTTTLDRRRRIKSSRDAESAKNPKPPLMGSQSSRRRRSDGGAVVGHNKGTNKNVLEIQRGVRPRLDHIQCPVTQKTLMMDDDGYIDASLASTSISSSTTSDDHSYDDDDGEDQYSDSDIGLNQTVSRDEVSRRKNRSSTNRDSNTHKNGSHLDGRKAERLERDSERNHRNNPQQRRRRLPKHYNSIPEAAVAVATDRDQTALSKTKGPDKKQSNITTHQKRSQASPSSKISTEIAQFQKMVADLESLSRSSASSPEAMWKSRILLRSAHDADRDLKLALEKAEREAAAEGGTRSVAASARISSRKKIQRDYHRASEQFRSIVEETERRQRAEISCLTASDAAAAGVNPEGGATAAAQKRVVMGAAEAEEDFFDRAMRERQSEIQKISDSMKKVQGIYTDLAGLVDGQQDQIDQLEDINDEVKTDTRAGLEEIQHGMWKLCVADQHKKDGSGGNGPNNSFDLATNRNRRKKTINSSDILNCMMVCHGPPKHKSQGSFGGGDGLTLDDDLYHERAMTPQNSKNNNANYYRDDPQGSESAWNIPNLEHVQESAQDAYERGHAMVGGLVGQVHEVVTSGEGLPLQLREVGNRISCTPQPEEYFSSENNSDDETSNEMGCEETGTAKVGSDENDCREERFEEERHHRREGQRRRSRHRSRSRSKPKHKDRDRNGHHQQEPEQWEENDHRQHDEAPSQKKHQQRKGHGPRRNISSR